jgi:acetoin utilization deacetylase AcuC-like enzyme
VIVVATERHRGHAPLAEIESSGLQAPFEHPGRADAILATVSGDRRFDVVEPDRATTAPIEAVHEPGLVRFLETAWSDYQRRHPGTHDVVPDVFSMSGLRRGMGEFPPPSNVDAALGRWCFETTTPLTEGTYDAARSAVDVALFATTALLGGSRTAYGLCRPPGHHAPSGMYGGYCFFNNAAIAAHHVAHTTGTKVTVLDVDFHHGNGTQQIFYERDDVQYVSLHGDPARVYPYVSGYADEVGSGVGRGTTLNIALAAGTGDDAYIDELSRACSAIEKFGPSLLVVSLGLDAYFNDPISDLSITTDGFHRQGALVAELALPTMVLQEGGYDVDALGDNARAWLLGLEFGR